MARPCVFDRVDVVTSGDPPLHHQKNHQSGAVIIAIVAGLYPAPRQ